MGFSLKRTLKKAGGMLFGQEAQPGPANPFSLTYKDLDFLNDPAKGQFKDLIDNINAPSSVDAVRREVEGDRLGQLLSSIDEDTDRAVGGIKMDFLDRGLAGPGAGSDIEFSALGTARGGGVKAKSEARLGAMMAELDRLKSREAALTGAYGTRYNAGVAGKSQLAQLMASLYSGGANREIEGRTARQPGIFENMLNAGVKKFGEETGGGLAGKMFGF